jgi:hypothetical protein
VLWETPATRATSLLVKATIATLRPASDTSGNRYASSIRIDGRSVTPTNMARQGQMSYLLRAGNRPAVGMKRIQLRGDYGNEATSM